MAQRKPVTVSLPPALEEQVQKLTDEYIAKIDALMKKKEAEIMTV